MKFYTYLMGKGWNFGKGSKCLVVAFLPKDGDNEIWSEFKDMQAKGFIFFKENVDIKLYDCMEQLSNFPDYL